MTPTNKLRWVRRKPKQRPTIAELEKILAQEGEHAVEIHPDGSVSVGQMVLQQWWVNVPRDVAHLIDTDEGEWRDLPIEEEK